MAQCAAAAALPLALLDGLLAVQAGQQDGVAYV